MNNPTASMAAQLKNLVGIAFHMKNAGIGWYIFAGVLIGLIFIWYWYNFIR